MTTTICPFLFVYGTLKTDSSHPNAVLLRRTNKYIGQATVSGLLYNIQYYPGLIYGKSLKTKVTGELFEMPDPVMTLEFLDKYEGYGPEFTKPNEYLRKLIQVNFDNKEINAWTYIYNWEVQESKLIASGVYQND